MLQLRHLFDMEKIKEGENVRNVYISQLQNELRYTHWQYCATLSRQAMCHLQLCTFEYV